ncbi:adenylyltransferase/cytidyltransferase family protein [uncultured Sphingomonas sp.]|uniref:adenylyltransferase/cytidyltransferase family protein n=1 Tax=uncultured Sphingomonas sp. TaxID=158754 RepID=UPI0025F320F7|nr:adenylyltransferase/cytidyltransferase family protein [uncultured Sphingomonas sp.]
MERLNSGSVHGRFQPFHNGHLDYVLQAADRADYIHIGLTQVFQPLLDKQKTGRDTRDANPLTFFERSRLVAAALEEYGISKTRFNITPFPIETPNLLPQFVPVSVPCFTTLVTSWNDEKVSRLEAVGYHVQTLQVSPLDNNRVTSGTEIRQLIRSGDNQWARYVPSSVADLIAAHYQERF